MTPESSRANQNGARLATGFEFHERPDSQEVLGVLASNGNLGEVVVTQAQGRLWCLLPREKDSQTGEITSALTLAAIPYTPGEKVGRVGQRFIDAVMDGYGGGGEAKGLIVKAGPAVADYVKAESAKGQGASKALVVATPQKVAKPDLFESRDGREFDEKIDTDMDRKVKGIIVSVVGQLLSKDERAKELVRQVGMEHVEGILNRKAWGNDKEAIKRLRDMSHRSLELVIELVGKKMDWQEIYNNYRGMHPDAPELFTPEGFALFLNEVMPGVVVPILSSPRLISERADMKVEDELREQRARMVEATEEVRHKLWGIKESNRTDEEKTRLNLEREVEEVRDENSEVITKGKQAQGRIWGAQAARWVHIFGEGARAVPSIYLNLFRGHFEFLESWGSVTSDRRAVAMAGLGVGAGVIIGSAGLVGSIIYAVNAEASVWVVAGAGSLGCLLPVVVVPMAVLSIYAGIKSFSEATTNGGGGRRS